ncbi:MAG TPA: tripartite tricarboxylate transporter TctB family protein [Devosiaceae bacterium]|jgi:hypothetical protein|nr:tripartite tricarboxylate transporter TctB family protein [Devosiaceae bacterium]
MTVNSKNLGAGLTFLSVTAIYGGTALQSLPMGSLTSMGPGFFPAALCVILAGLGTILVVTSIFEARQPAFGSFAWRALFTISAGVLFFGTFIRETGLALAVFVTAFVVSLAAAETRPPAAAAIALALSAFCVVVFIYGLRLPLPVIGSWPDW